MTPRSLTGIAGSIAMVASLGILAACGKQPADQAQPPVPTATTPVVASSPPEASATPSVPSHGYQMVDNGTYGYEPALSEEDVRNGTSMKPLLMMRYVGNKNGTYVILILGHDANDTGTVNRVSCQAPCQFVKSETLSNDIVLKTETLRVTPDSLIGVMLQDAVSGQLIPYAQGSRSAGSMPIQPATTVQPVAPAPAAPQASGASDMWVGTRDMFLRSCPGTTCAALAVVPKLSQVSVDTASVRSVTEADGTQTPWARVTYSGPTCDPATLDRQLGCVNPVQGNAQAVGWMNYQRLTATPSQ